MPVKTVRHRRLLAIERRLAIIEQKLLGELAAAREEVATSRVRMALGTATVARLIGENDRLRENLRRVSPWPGGL